ncbi:MAG: DUF2783 domain-containing protein [Sphingopyxis sp.]
MTDSRTAPCSVDDVYARLGSLVADQSEPETIRAMTRLILLMANEIGDFATVCALIEQARSKGD